MCYWSFGGDDPSLSLPQHCPNMSQVGVLPRLMIVAANVVEEATLRRAMTTARSDGSAPADTR